MVATVNTGLPGSSSSPKRPRADAERDADAYLADADTDQRPIRRRESPGAVGACPRAEAALPLSAAAKAMEDEPVVPSQGGVSSCTEEDDEELGRGLPTPSADVTVAGAGLPLGDIGGSRRDSGASLGATSASRALCAHALPGDSGSLSSAGAFHAQGEGVCHEGALATDSPPMASVPLRIASQLPSHEEPPPAHASATLQPAQEQLPPALAPPPAAASAARWRAPSRLGPNQRLPPSSSLVAPPLMPAQSIASNGALPRGGQHFPRAPPPLPKPAARQRTIIPVESQSIEDINGFHTTAGNRLCTDCKSYYVRFRLTHLTECRPDCSARRQHGANVPSTQQSFWNMSVGSAASQQESPSAAQPQPQPRLQQRRSPSFQSSLPQAEASQPVWDSQF